MTGGVDALLERLAVDERVVAFAARFVLAVMNGAIGALILLAIATAPIPADALVIAVVLAALLVVTAIVFAFDARAVYCGEAAAEVTA